MIYGDKCCKSSLLSCSSSRERERECVCVAMNSITSPIPDDYKYKRSEHFHHVLVFLEEKINENDIHDERINQVKKVVLPYWIKEKHTLKMGKSHRELLWLVIVRLNYLCSLACPDTGEYLSFPTLKNAEIFCTKTPISEYNVSTVIRMIHIIVNKIQHMVYCDDIYRLVNCLFDRACFLCCVDCGNRIIMDNDAFVEKEGRFYPRTHTLFLLLTTPNTGNGYRVNKMFMWFVEVNFRHLYRKFKRYQELTPSEAIPNAGNEKVKAFRYLIQSTKDRFNDVIWDEFKKKIYDNYVFDSEREMFRYHNPQMEDSSYNVIAEYRTDHIDFIVDLIDKSSIEKILSPVSSSTKTVDRNYDLLVLLLFRYLCESSNIEFSESSCVVNNERDNLRHCSKYPLIVRRFNLYGLYWKRKFFTFSNIDQCLLHWIIWICEDKQLNGRISSNSTRKSSFINLYEKILSRQQTSSNMFIERDDYFLELPVFY